MRRFTLVRLFTLCGTLLVLWIIALAMSVGNAGSSLIVPGATDGHIERFGAGQRIVYRMPLNQTYNDIQQHLIRNGWIRDAHGVIYGVSSPSYAEETDFFWQAPFGLVSEVVGVRPATKSRQMIELSLSRCLNVYSWFYCF